MKILFNQRYSPHPAQRRFHNSGARFKLIGGAMGGGKSKALCAEAVARSVSIPGNRGAIVRKNLSTLRRTTFVTFMNTVPPELIESFSRTEMKVTFTNGSEILFLEADESKDPLFEKLKSLELGWFAIDEASEVPRAAFQILASRLRWPAAVGSYVGLLASNPEQCWLKEDFIDKPKPGFRFFPSLPGDNPSLPADYLPNLRNLFDEDQQRKYLEGDWNIGDDPLQVIPWSALRHCIATDEELAAASGIEYLGVDVAELGDDKSVLARFRGPVCVGIESFSKKRIDELAHIVQNRIVSSSIDADHVGVDSVGNGAGVWGILRGNGFEVRRIIGGATPEPADDNANRFANLKSQMWWALRAAVIDPNSGLRIPNRQSLLQDLAAPRYRIEAERTITVEPKEKLRRRIGRSPDEADALVIAHWLQRSTHSRKYNFGFLR